MEAREVESDVRRMNLLCFIFPVLVVMLAGCIVISIFLSLHSNIKWNFTKFLIDKDGHVAKRYGPNEDPSAVEKDLPSYLPP